MTDIFNQSALTLAARVRTRQLSAVETARGALARISATDGVVNACTQVMATEALRDAADIDARVARGEDPGPLGGVPFVVKNLFDIAGIATLAGARQRLGAPAAGRDATAVTRLKSAGAIMVAATNMDEFAYGFTTENDYFGPTRNPRSLDHVAGGSSGGAAAAVAAGMAPLALGSDTNGSIRIPSAFCGVFGLKPTFGRLSRAGTHPFVASLDHVGPMARTVADLALAYDLMQGPDPHDPVCAQRSPEPVSGLLDKEIGALRIGVLDGWFRQGAEDSVLAAIDDAARLLGPAPRVELAESDLARAAAFAITASEGANLHLERLRRDASAFDPATRDRLLAGALMPAALVIQAQRFRRRYQATAKALFEAFDVLLAPAAPGPALMLGEPMLARARLGIFTQPLSFIGLPIIAAPIPQAQGLPVGIQIIAAPWRETAAFQVAAHLERQGLARSAVAPCRKTPTPAADRP